MREAMQKFVDGFGLGITKEALAHKVYREFAGSEDVYLINDRYLHIDGENYQFIKSRRDGRWIVKEF